MKKLYILTIILFSLLVSCTKDEIKIDPNNLLIGTWNYAGYSNNVSIYARSLSFSDNYCYQFNSDGTLVERSISGWCATPPVSYANYDGTWTVLNDTLIQIQVEYWGGTRDYKLGINSVTRDSLKIEEVTIK
jgi:hypothetical protein